MAGGYLASGLDPTFIIEVRLARLQHCELLACGWMAADLRTKQRVRLCHGKAIRRGRRLPGAQRFPVAAPACAVTALRRGAELTESDGSRRRWRSSMARSVIDWRSS
jgi:hypothetical protein